MSTLQREQLVALIRQAAIRSEQGHPISAPLTDACKALGPLIQEPRRALATARQICGELNQQWLDQPRDQIVAFLRDAANRLETAS